MMVGEHLQLRIQVEIEKDETSKSGCGVAARKALERIINGVPIAGANRTVIHDLPQPISYLDAVVGDYWLADCQEVRTKATNEPFEEDLEDCSCDQGVEQTDDGVVDVPEGTCGVGVNVVAFKNELVNLRMRNCMQSIMKIGIVEARNAASQMGMISWRSGYANCG
jgi:hypothetical protein